MDDRMEAMIADALDKAGIHYTTDYGGKNPSGLDFNLIDHGVEIEVKRLHSPRIAEQMSRAPNVIAAQGDVAVRFLAEAIAAMEPPSQPGANGIG